MSKSTEQRPPQVGMASAIVIFSSLLVLFTAWERVTTLGSLETQQAVRDVIGEAPFASLGLDVTSATELLRITCAIAMVASCATAILGWYVRKPDKAARLGLTLFAVPVFVSGLPVGGLAGSFVAAGAAMLWIQPGREWFATGRWTPPTPPEVERRTSHGDGPGQQAGGWPPAAPPTQPPPAARPFGEPPTQGQPPATHNAYGQPLPPGQAPPQAVQQPAPQAYQQGPPPGWHQRQLLLVRPSAMVAAFVITVVSAGGLLAFFLLGLALAGLSPDLLRTFMEEGGDEMIDASLTVDQVRTSVLAFTSVGSVWCAVALTFAGFAMARRAWARRALIISAALSAGACFAVLLSSPLSLLPALAAVAVIVCLRRDDVRRWFAHDAR